MCLYLLSLLCLQAQGQLVTRGRGRGGAGVYQESTECAEGWSSRLDKDCTLIM